MHSLHRGSVVRHPSLLLPSSGHRSLPDPPLGRASPTSLWTGSHGVASEFHVWGFLALVRDTSEDKLSVRAIPCIFLGFPVDSSDFDCAPSTLLPSGARQVASPSPQSSSQSPQQPSALPRQVTVDSGGVGAGGAANGDIRSRGALLRGAGARVLALEVLVRGVVELEVLALEVLVLGVVELEVLALEVPFLGVLELEVLALEVLILGVWEQEVLAQEVLVPRRLELEALLLRLPTVTTHVSRQLAAVSVRSRSGWSRSSWSSLLPRTALRFSPPQSQSPPPVLPHVWTTHCPPRARPSSPLYDLCTNLLHSSPPRAAPVSVLLSPPASSLTVSSHPTTAYYCATHPVVSLVLAPLVTDPRASSSSVSALTAAFADFASTRCLNFATRVVAAPPARPLSTGGEFALGCDVLEDKQFDLEFLATASPSLWLLSPKGGPGALDIPTPCTLREAVSGEWASQCQS
ncbi:unnamed protein product [Closterium sp. NIES-65]|nr:unnamed protein product [Closterium sp. NIES-65]